MESLVYGIGFILLAIFGLVWYLHSFVNGFVKLGKDLDQIADVLDAGLEGSYETTPLTPTELEKVMEDVRREALKIATPTPAKPDDSDQKGTDQAEKTASRHNQTRIDQKNWTMRTDLIADPPEPVVDRKKPLKESPLQITPTTRPNTEKTDQIKSPLKTDFVIEQPKKTSQMSIVSGREQIGTFTQFFWTVFENPFGFYLILLAVIAISWSICTIGPSIGSSISAVAYGLFSAKGPRMTTSLESYKLATTLTCQRIEPSLPLSCKTQTGNSELRGARVQKPKGEKYFWVQIITDNDIIDLAECNNDPTITECYRVRDIFNNFVNGPMETIRYVSNNGKIYLKIADGNLTITY